MQALLVAATFGITHSPAALAFPLLILALIPLRRHALPRILGAEALAALDPEDWGAAEEEEEKRAGRGAAALGADVAAGVEREARPSTSI
jgi:hypothetical protein